MNASKLFSVRVARPSDDDNSYSVVTIRGNYLHFLLVPLVWSIPSMWRSGSWTRGPFFFVRQELSTTKAPCWPKIHPLTSTIHQVSGAKLQSICCYLTAALNWHETTSRPLVWDGDMWVEQMYRTVNPQCYKFNFRLIFHLISNQLKYIQY